MPTPRTGKPPKPPIDFDSHREAAEMEDVEWLTTRGDCSLEQALERVGISLSCYEQRIARAKRATLGRTA